MLNLVPSLLLLLTLPLPEKGTLIPVSLRVADDAPEDERAMLSERVAALREAVCKVSRHVRLVRDPAKAVVPFEVGTYEVMSVGETHHFTGRFYIHGKWEPFRSWAGAGSELPPPGLGRFVEDLVFDSTVIERERLQDRGANGRDLPRSPADVARCMAVQ